MVESGGSQTICAQQLVCELLAFGARNVVLSARRRGRDIGRPVDAVNTLWRAGHVVEAQDVVLLTLPRSLRDVFCVFWLRGGACFAVGAVGRPVDALETVRAYGAPLAASLGRVELGVRGLARQVAVGAIPEATPPDEWPAALALRVLRE